MKIVIDMNLSPEWVLVFDKYDIESVHWSEIGDPRAADEAIMAWATQNDYVVFTHDLDFGSILAATQSKSPSVIQARTQNVLPLYLEPFIMRAIRQFETELRSGALITVDEKRAKARILPIIWR